MADFDIKTRYLPTYAAKLNAFVPTIRSKEPQTPSFADGQRGLRSWPTHPTGAQEQRSGFEHAVLSYETSTSQFG